MRASQGWSGAAGSGQHLQVMDEGKESRLMEAKARWRKEIRMNSEDPQVY